MSRREYKTKWEREKRQRDPVSALAKERVYNKSDQGRARTKKHNDKRRQTVVYKVSQYKANALKRKRCWELSDEDACSMMLDTCYYCGQDASEKLLGIDRKNNSLGYSYENSVPCCKECNFMKGRIFDDVSVVQHARKMVEYNDNKIN